MGQPRIDIGTVVGGRFEVDGFVGSGGMAMVYSARDTRHDRPAALKVLSARLAKTDEFRRRFNREARIAEHAFHPNILPIWDSGEDGGVLYIATPLADGDLGGLIDREGRLDAEPALAIFDQVAWALDAAHDSQVVHRDVKPENVLLVERPSRPYHVYLADFGVAKAGYSLTLTSGRIPFTAPYASPEQIQGRSDLDGRADQYSLGCALYETLAGHPPFEYSSEQQLLWAHLSERPPLIGTMRPELRALDEVLARAMAKHRDDRFTSCQAVVDAAREALTGAPVAAVESATELAAPSPPPPPPPRPRPPRPPEGAPPPRPPRPPRAVRPAHPARRTRVAVPGAAGAALVVGALALILIPSGGAGGGGQRESMQPQALTVDQLPDRVANGFLSCISGGRQKVDEARKILGAPVDGVFDCEPAERGEVRFLLTRQPDHLLDGVERAVRRTPGSARIVGCRGSPGAGRTVCFVARAKEGDRASIAWADARFSNVVVIGQGGGGIAAALGVLSRLGRLR